MTCFCKFSCDNEIFHSFLLKIFHFPMSKDYDFAILLRKSFIFHCQDRFLTSFIDYHAFLILS